MWEAQGAPCCRAASRAHARTRAKLARRAPSHPPPRSLLLLLCGGRAAAQWPTLSVMTCCCPTRRCDARRSPARARSHAWDPPPRTEPLHCPAPQYFSSNRLCLLDRGWVFAMAHVRGGGEMGRQWYENGKYLHKKNSFTDFIAAAGAELSGGAVRVRE